MAKVILKFTKGHGRYVKDDVAGFDEIHARKLASVTVPYDPGAPVEPVRDDAVVGVFEQREADLNRREADLEAREAAADQAGAGDPPAQGSAKAGDPPAQGGKSTAVAK